MQYYNKETGLIKNLLRILFILYTFASCNLFDYHSLDGNVNIHADGKANAGNISVIEMKTLNKSNIRFAFISDTHRDDDETALFVKHINERSDIDFILHGGDVTDYGYKREFEWTYRNLGKLTAPHIVLLGNHDIPAYGNLIYESVYGPANFTFVAGSYKFIALNTNRLEYENPENIPDFNFINQQLADYDKYKGIIIVMHAPPSSDQFYGEEIVRKFSNTLLQIPNLYFCLYGHTHHHAVSELLNDGIVYIGCDNIAKRSYLIVDLSPDIYSYEVIRF
jgi:3',5'-cyclic AMP phosphodiesterase CpdA